MIVFHKMTGSGNDFVMIDGRTSNPAEWPAERIARICDRRNGIGGDGLVFVMPVGPDTVRMTYFNSDGSPAPMCGNAALCSTRLACRLEMADPAGMTLVTDAATFSTRCVGPGHMAELHLPDTDVPVPLTIALESGEKWIRRGVVGVPHLLVLVEDLAALEIDRRGRALRFAPEAGPGGANVNFVGRIHSPDAADPSAASWGIRTYERGIEAETLACGTGTVAAGLALASLGLAQLPCAFRSASGKLLSVAANALDGRARDIWLAGEGRLVGRGVWLEN
ncbi:MAG: diaminopimelate epimerase [Gemmatimonadales bacterium]